MMDEPSPSGVSSHSNEAIPASPVVVVDSEREQQA